MRCKIEKIKYSFVIITIFLISFVVCGCSIGAKNDNFIEYEKLPQPELSIEQKAFNDIVEKIKELEDLSNRFDEQNATKNVLIYLRSEKYNTNEWNLIAGTINTEFENFVKNNEQKQCSTLRNLESFVIPKTNEKCDFVHLFAVVNVYYSSQSNNTAKDLASWGGDLCQLAVDAKKSNKTGEELKIFVKNSFNGKSGGFNAEDVCADFDAVGISANILNNMNIADSFKSYYENISKEQRIITFKQQTFGNNQQNVTDLTQQITSRIKNNLLLKIWGQKNGLDFNNDTTIIDCCAEVFAEYIY